MEEDIIQKIIGLLDSGKSPAEIFAMFPDREEEIQNLFELFKKINKEKESLNPSPVFKKKLFNAFKDEKSELEHFPKWASALQNRLKYLLPLVVGTALVALVLTKGQNFGFNSKPTTQIDQTVSAIISDYTGDSDISAGGDKDIQDINQTYQNYNVNDVYNENTF